MLNKIITVLLLAAALFIAAVSCDMTLIKDGSSSGRDITAEERDKLELSGRFLKLTYMPLNTQAMNVSSVQIANSSSSIAKLDKDSLVKIFLEESYSVVYIPITYNDGNEFIENGIFYVSFTVHVDAVSSFILNPSDRFLVTFAGGRGELDVRMLPSYRGLEHRYLAIYNLPPHLFAQNISKVSIHNQTETVAQCEDYSLIEAFTSADSSTARIPLVYSNSSSRFAGTGSFYVSFDLYIDALTHFTVTAQDKALVPFYDGNGSLNINDLPSASAVPCLTIFNLPSNFSANNLSNVSIYDQSGQVAKCSNYNLIEIKPVGNFLSVNIPLFYSNKEAAFTETGFYFISFSINIDAVTCYNVTLDKKVKVSFLNGYGSLDINNIPQETVPYLIIKSLPQYATIQHISSVGVYGKAGQVASCSNYQDIIISSNGSLTTAMIPLSSGSGFFSDTGSFYITFTVNVDYYTQISFSQKDELVLFFTNGCASYDVAAGYGFFEGALYNPGDTLIPVIKSGVKFELGGVIRTVSSNVTLQPPQPASTCLLYVYAYFFDNTLYFELSNQIPSYIESKKGFYLGGKRALWKMLYLKDSSGDKYFSKTYIADNFPQFDKTVISNDNAVLQGSPYYSFPGSNNPSSTPISLPPGIYAVKTTGAGGGGGCGYVDGTAVGGSSRGGAGGLVSEIFTLNKQTSFTVFTGSGGTAASGPAAAGAFDFSYVFQYRNQNSTTNSIEKFTVAAGAGGSGGGGGAGSFLYSDQGYFLLAGGGGSGSGGSYITPGGGGGAGGVIGSGGGGGAAGYLQQTNGVSTAYITSSGGTGGQGGGYSGGTGGSGAGVYSSFNGSAGSSSIPSTSSAQGGSGSISYNSGSFPQIDNKVIEILPYNLSNSGYIYSSTDSRNYSISSSSGNGGSIPVISYSPGLLDWQNTNSAHGAGASSTGLDSVFTYSYKNRPTPNDSQITIDTIILGSKKSGVAGSSGGNNRNTTKGGGAAGGALNGSLPSNGAAGSVVIYKLY